MPVGDEKFRAFSSSASFSFSPTPLCPVAHLSFPLALLVALAPRRLTSRLHLYQAAFPLVDNQSATFSLAHKPNGAQGP